MVDFPKYESYKNSEIPWLGGIPSHWDLRKNKFLLKEKKDVVGKKSTNFTLLSLTLQGVIARDMENPQGKFPAEFNTYKIVSSGDLIFCLFDIEETPRTVGHSTQNGMITGAYEVFDCESIVDSKYFYYYYLSLDFDKRLQSLYSGLRKVIKVDTFLGISSPVPPIEEQRRIVEFLDRKTAEIDQAIAQKQRLIELLKEQKAILIDRAVTKGLNSSILMQDSEVRWIGEIPKHWEVRRSKRLFSQRKEFAQSDDIQLSATQAYGVIPQEEYENRIGRKVTKIFQHLEKHRHVEVGDFVISMRSFQGGLERAWAKGCIRSSYVVLKPSKLVDVDFFSYVFKSSVYIIALQSTANFIRDGQDLNFDNFCAVDLALPPIEEQRAIAQTLNIAVANNSKVAECTKKEIDLLQEFRQVVIANAVTGKIKV